MTDYPQRMTDSFNERKRLIRLRRKKENLRFWDEFGIIPRWLKVLVGVLYVLAVVIAVKVNLMARYNPNGNEMFPPELRSFPAAASLALAGIVTGISLGMAIMIFLVAYVNRDASRRGMSAALWTILVICKCNLHPSCPQCKHELAETDKFCPFCGNDLKSPADSTQLPAQNPA